ncbi:probable integral peroxisomal membrane protein [Rhynchosporium graminicola]|uniref:Probable integral peroxisomal membrane protein n=1 Tax=Rhynchosporium graminicola TaxID=2792576 RepID=A0A1E1JVQ4_9HELO|nr:probable integral peroxisomal membrane protein [Rhynchosporium commune]
MSSTPSSSRRDDDGTSIAATNDPNPPTIAAFSPVTLSSSHAPNANKQRSTILVHQKSPLLIATPPQITRALAYSHPFLLPLNQFVGLLTWTSGDPWESFLLVASFWGVVLYGDVVMRFAGPVVVVTGLILGMYSRRYSPLSSTGWTGEKQKKGHKKLDSEATNIKHQKTLDEIVETLKVLTSRCNVLLDPLLELTDFLSTQRTATSATTRPALTTLLIRILLVTPLWILLTLHPVRLITTKRIVLLTGTIFFTWHSRPNRVTRTILWRSASVRRVCTFATGLHFSDPAAIILPPSKTSSSSSSSEKAPPLPPRRKSALEETAALAASQASKRRPDAPGVRFTFILYENQRRWLGLGWTTSLFAYERASWTDEHLNPAPAKEEFELPDTEGGAARWRWAEGGRWLVEGAGESDEGGKKAKEDSVDGGMGWIYYDNKWQNGRRGVDGWGRYTRRRKWYRDAELVEVSPSTEITPSPTPTRTSIPNSNSNFTNDKVSKTPRTPTSSENITNPPPITSPPPENSILDLSSSHPKTNSKDKDKDAQSIKDSIRSKASTSSSKSDNASLKGSIAALTSRNGPGSGSLRRKGMTSSEKSSLHSAGGRERDRERDEEGPGTVRPRDVDSWGISDDARMGLDQ